LRNRAHISHRLFRLLSNIAKTAVGRLIHTCWCCGCNRQTAGRRPQQATFSTALTRQYARASIANQLRAAYTPLSFVLFLQYNWHCFCTYPTSTSRSVFRVLQVFPANCTRVDFYTDGGAERSRVPRKATKQTPSTRLTAVGTLQHKVLKGSLCGLCCSYHPYFVNKWPEHDNPKEHQHCAPTRTPFPPSRSTKQ
ncbi:unnamed protein product, partial [Ectocarpus sp. 4 AP-2014]